MKHTLWIGLLSLSMWVGCQPGSSTQQQEEEAETSGQMQERMLTDSLPVSREGQQIYYEVSGSGTRTLVFVHGWCIDGSYWSEQVRHFAPDWQVVTLDLVGHGQSGTTRNTWTMQAFAEDVKAVVEHLNLTEVILIGHSMSDAVVLEAARRMPGKVKALIGIDTFVEPNPFLSEEEKEEFVDFAEAFREAFQDITYMYVGGLIDPGTDSTVRESILQDIIQGPDEVCAPILESIFEYQQSGQYLAAVRKNQLPIYAINAIEPETVEWKAFNPQFEWIVLENVGHYPMKEDPAQLNRKLESVLGSDPGIIGSESVFFGIESVNR